jgi:CheY-like chemotaxis protein/DNA-binding CsgD family transcriptional regulator
MATVLVVDDEPDLRELLRINLSLDGHHVLLAADGDEALRVAHADSPDLILLDVMMPRRDGWEVLGAMKAGEPDVASIPVVMLTAKADEMDRVRGGIEGAIRYVTKPFSVSELRYTVSQALLGGPEAAQRRRAQHEALTRLARLERSGFTGGHAGGSHVGAGRGDGRPDLPAAKPRLTRLESRPARPALGAPRQWRSSIQSQVANLSGKQMKLLEAVGGTRTVSEAAESLGVSRSYVYASLRRIARKLGVRDGPELVAMARQGALRPNE